MSALKQRQSCSLKDAAFPLIVSLFLLWNWPDLVENALKVICESVEAVATCTEQPTPCAMPLTEIDGYQLASPGPFCSKESPLAQSDIQLHTCLPVLVWVKLLGYRSRVSMLSSQFMLFALCYDLYLFIQKLKK